MKKRKLLQLLQNFKKFDFGNPNLLSILPVEILDSVFASTPGFILIPIEVIRLIFLDILSSMALR